MTANSQCNSNKCISDKIPKVKKCSSSYPRDGSTSAKKIRVNCSSSSDDEPPSAFSDNLKNKNDITNLHLRKLGENTQKIDDNLNVANSQLDFIKTGSHTKKNQFSNNQASTDNDGQVIDTFEGTDKTTSKHLFKQNDNTINFNTSSSNEDLILPVTKIKLQKTTTVQTKSTTKNKKRMPDGKTTFDVSNNSDSLSSDDEITISIKSSPARLSYDDEPIKPVKRIEAKSSLHVDSSSSDDELVKAVQKTVFKPSVHNDSSSSDNEPVKPVQRTVIKHLVHDESSSSDDEPVKPIQRTVIKPSVPNDSSSSDDEIVLPKEKKFIEI
uniref:Nucleolin 2-like n=1 Tax=Dermatophagoides pteronyssinus TaxID=6956 RepID=A0A6P6XQ13_DERPT|nr:nucleolin 2-like [Dermatophagoides pteronyssinus]